MKYIEYLIEKYKGSYIVIDTNLLLLYLIGLTDLRLLKRGERTDKFSIDDFKSLVSILENFKLKTTSNILTESSNLLQKSHYKKVIPEYKNMVNTSFESRHQSRILIKNKYFDKIRLTDVGIFKLASKNLVITDDYDLYGIIASNGFDAINFTHIQQYNLEMM